MTTTVKIGDRVRYTYSMGTKRGEVVDISLDLENPKKPITWITVVRTENNKEVFSRILGTAERMKTLKFKIIFRDAA